MGPRLEFQSAASPDGHIPSQGAVSVLSLASLPQDWLQQPPVLKAKREDDPRIHTRGDMLAAPRGGQGQALGWIRMSTFPPERPERTQG